MQTHEPAASSRRSILPAIEGLRQTWAVLRARWMERPFARLVLHFASIIIQSGQESGASELNLSLGGILAILAVPGGIVSILLMDKYSSLLAWLRRWPAMDPYVISIPDKYFFILFSMVITGVVTVMKWDRILPGRQDYANLAPLPLASRTIFLANLTAIVMLASIFAVDVNAVSAILFPAVVLSAKGTLPAIAAFMMVHAVCVILASAFTFFGCFAIMGLLMAGLPRRWFRRASVAARVTILGLLMAALCTSFAVAPQIARLKTHPHSFVRFLPPVWYLGLYQSMQGKAGPELAALGQLGWRAAGAVFMLAMILGAISYRRHFERIPESLDSPHPVSGKSWSIVPAALDRWFLRNPMERACYHFALRALLRSETHSILFGAFLGLGLVTASQLALSAPAAAALKPDPFPSADLLAAPLCLAYFLIAGLRCAFEVPAELGANWAFRLLLKEGKSGARQVARKLMMTFLLPAVLLPTLAIYTAGWGWRTGLPHALTALGLALLLVEISLLRFRKIPFSCALPRLQNHAIAMMLICFVGFWIFITVPPGIERWMLAKPVRFLGMALFLAAAWQLLQSIRDEAEEIGEELVYEAEASREIQTLNILGTV